MFVSVVAVADISFNDNVCQWPKSCRRAQVLAVLNLLDEEDSGGNDTEDQEIAFN